MKKPNDEIIIYEGDNNQPRIEVRLKGETVWLSQMKIAALFGVQRPAITKHLKNIFESGELDENTVSSILEHTASDGKTYQTKFYNLDAIISVGYRVNSVTATRFRQWATARLREYIIKGFTMDDERLKGAGGGNYWKELLERIRDIRSSEKALYRQVLDLYATSIDYSPNSKESIFFFKTVQNKLHYATNKKTAAEIIHERADAEKDFMGLTTFADSLPIRSEISIAKNYLTEDEIFRLNRMVSAFFDLAEIKAQEQTKMRMADWIAELDKFAANFGKGILLNAGKISTKQAQDKALKEYLKYQAKTLSPIEKIYLKSIKTLGKKAEKKVKTAQKKNKDEEFITEKIHNAYRMLLSRDVYLLKIDANERSITHKLAEYLQNEFPEWNVDCEYNRDRNDKKTDGNSSVYPDIIIHHRGTTDNLVAIEAKKNKFKGKDNDNEKLQTYKNVLYYQYAFKVIFPIGNELKENFDIDEFIQGG